MRKYLDIISGSVETTDAPAAAKSNLLQRYVGLIEEGYVNPTISGLKVDEFVRGYIEAMLWSTSDESNEAGGECLNKKFTADDIDHASMDRIYADCRSFLHTAGPFLNVDKYKGPGLTTLEAMAGHDFWLTRVGHGSGFWDGDWEGEDDGRFDGPLTKAAKAFGNIDPYVGDDCKIHLM
jgi:hypothetical protein